MTGRPLRIAFLIRAFPTVSETFIRDQIEGLRDRGHEVDVFSLYVGATSPEEEVGADVRYLIGQELPLPRAILRAAARALWSTLHPRAFLQVGLLFRRQPRIGAEALHALPVLAPLTGRHDIIHAHYGPTGMLALALRKAGSLCGRVVTTFHGIDLSRYPLRNGPGCYDWLFEEGEAFTVNSRFSEERAVVLGAPPSRLHRLRVGVPLDRIPFDPPTRPDSGPVRLLSVGRLEEVKGFGYGLRAVRLLLDRGIDARYTVVGGGRLHDRLRQEAAGLGLDSVVQFTGPLSFAQVIREMGRHHLLLMPGVETTDRQAETQGRVLVEAQAAGMPVVATEVGGIPETLAAGAGTLVPPRDSGALADAVLRLIDQSEEWREMGRRGRAHVERHYDQEDLLDRLIRIYHHALGGGASGDRRPS